VDDQPSKALPYRDWLRHVAPINPRHAFGQAAETPLGITVANSASSSNCQSSEVSMIQIRADNQPVTQITIVDSEPDQQAEALAVMSERARFMARQPGFISISLHRSLDGRRIVNYVQWQNRELLRSAHQSPEFRKEWGHFDQVTDEIDPNLYEVTQVMDSSRSPT
jgi:heme-degrading monooxygenase HmoA